VPGTTTDLMTGRQRDYLIRLLNTRDMTHIGPDALQQIVTRVANNEVTNELASTWITRCLARPVKSAQPASQHSPISQGNVAPWQVHSYSEDLHAMVSRNAETERVPRGSYALETPGTEFTNNITFFSVWINADGSRWSVKVYASDELHKLSRATQYRVLDAIAENPAEAAELYGKEVGKCGICHRKLTNDISRARGIGPVCAARYGW
jgi:hypothetical protein